jgi:hypothetical protein
MNPRMRLLTALLLVPLAALLSWLVLPCSGVLPSAVAEQPVPGVLSAVYRTSNCSHDSGRTRLSSVTRQRELAIMPIT